MNTLQKIKIATFASVLALSTSAFAGNDAKITPLDEDKLEYGEKNGVTNVTQKKDYSAMPGKDGEKKLDKYGEKNGQTNVTQKIDKSSSMSTADADMENYGEKDGQSATGEDAE